MGKNCKICRIGKYTFSVHSSSSLLKIDQSDLRTWLVTLELSMLKAWNINDAVRAYLTPFLVLSSI